MSVMCCLVLSCVAMSPTLDEVEEWYVPSMDQDFMLLRSPANKNIELLGCSHLYCCQARPLKTLCFCLISILFQFELHVVENKVLCRYVEMLFQCNSFLCLGFLPACLSLMFLLRFGYSFYYNSCLCAVMSLGQLYIGVRLIWELVERQVCVPGALTSRMIFV